MEAFTPELREKMARLEKENEILHRRLESDMEAPLPESGERGSGSGGGAGDGSRKKVGMELQWNPSIVDTLGTW